MHVDDIAEIARGDGPLVAAALHNGHAVRPEVGRLLNLSIEERLREEDPFTGPWTRIAPTRIVGRRSRFEVDLNRPREKAVYQRPEDAWGLVVWKNHLPDELLRQSLQYYDAFYSAASELFDEKAARYRRFVVYDLHSYNYLRDGRRPADPAGNPEINVGTGTMDRAKWAPVVDRFIRDLSAFDFEGRGLDVRENVRFFGGEFPRWSHRAYPDSACVLAIEVKKIFMDEWTGELDRRKHALITQALAATVPGVMEELRNL